MFLKIIALTFIVTISLNKTQGYWPFQNKFVRKYESNGVNTVIRQSMRVVAPKYAYNRQFHGTDAGYNRELSNNDSSDSSTVNETTIDSIDDTAADEELRISMARDLYDDLCAGNPYLTKSQFLAWEDIADVMNGGTIDVDTMDIIFKEVGVFSEVISFEHFMELVDLVNQIAAALEGNEFMDEDEDGSEMFDDIITNELELNDNTLAIDSSTSSSSDAYDWLMKTIEPSNSKNI
jgi:hypothetical protein